MIESISDHSERPSIARACVPCEVATGNDVGSAVIFIDRRPKSDPFPICWKLNGNSTHSDGWQRLCFRILPLLTKPRLLRLNPLQQFRRRFILRILLHKLSPHRQIQNKPPQARHSIGCFADLFEMFQQPFRAHRSSASSRMAFSWSRSLAVSASLSCSLASSSAGSPWFSSTVWGFLKSRL